MIQSASERARDDAAPTNAEIAGALDETADLLQQQGANPFRVRAYHRASETIRELPDAVASIVQTEGVDGLVRLPGIGRSLAHAIDQLVRARRLSLLERLRGENTAERAFATVPDIGPELARRIHENLGIETLAELQAAANDGRLAQVPGMGRKRVLAVRESLAGRFHRPVQWETAGRPDPSSAVPVAELLEVDSEYRRLAEQDRLPKIAPRRFNPTGQAWLPVLHTERSDRHYTALFSNTARAHQMGTIRDWVVIYRDDESDHGRWTVITSSYGRLRGRRIVRGREAECLEYYQQQGDSL